MPRATGFPLALALLLVLSEIAAAAGGCTAPDEAGIPDIALAPFAADVGQDRVEEINFITRGGNYGWDIMEGEICNIGPAEACRGRGLIPPIATYEHSKGIAVTGGMSTAAAASPRCVASISTPISAPVASGACATPRGR